MSNTNYVFLDPLEILNNLSQFWSNCQMLEFSIFSAFRHSDREFLVKLTKLSVEH